MSSESVSYPSRRSLRDATNRTSAARHARHQRRYVPAIGRARARHANSTGEGFGPLVALTALGGVVPGASLLAGGWRRLGGLLVALFVASLVVVAGLAVTGHLTDLGIKLVTRPRALLVAAIVIVLFGLVWSLTIPVGHVLLRRNRLTGPQRVLSVVLVTALMGMIALPSATAARYALVQRSLVLKVFDDDAGDRDPGLAGPDTKARDPWATTPRVNVLLLGSDAGVDRVGTRPDTLIVASINTANGDTVLFSLPRNLERVPFPAGTPGAAQFPSGFYCPGHQECLLNGIWSWAEGHRNLFPGVSQPGLLATRQAVGEALGLSIDYYALVNLQGFQDVVNAIGGVQYDVERRIPIGGGTNQRTGGKYPISGYIEPGPQVLDGYHALWYARSREGSDDYDRMARQRCIIGAVADQAQPAKLALAFPKLAASAERNVETDIVGSELDAFVQLALRVQKGSLRSLPFTNKVIKPANPDFDKMREFVQEAIRPPAAKPSPSAPPSTPSTTPTPQTSQTPQTKAPANPDQAVELDQVCG
jgi:LCP family protein required for cell wall assembly